jgi:hypothetical protein
VLNELQWRELIDRFVDIDGIVDHHCLNFLFVIIRLAIQVFLLQSHSGRPNITPTSPSTLSALIDITAEQKTISDLR